MKTICVLAAAASISSSSLALAADPSIAELQEQLRQLQTKIEKLEADQQSTNTRAVDETVERVMRDSERRSRFLQDDTGLTAGYSDGRFFLQSTDGNWLLIPHFQFQFRNTTNYNSA